MMALKLLSAIISQDWREIVLTVLLASSILYYFFVHQRHGTRSKNDNKIIISDDERRQRREYLANIAEERAKRMAAAAAADAANTTTTTSSGGGRHGKENKKSAAVNITEKTLSKLRNTKINSQTQNKKNETDPAAASNIDSCKETVTDDKKKFHKNEVIGPPKNCAQDSLTEQRQRENALSNEMKDSSVQHNARENTQNNADEKPTTAASIGENKDVAVAKLSTQEQTQQQQEEESNSTLTLYLIKSASPRIQITIPKNASASKLRQIVSNATHIPSSGLRLIFRGRMIVEERKGGANVRDAVTEFGIEDGCALHVIGKSNNNEPGDVSSSNAAQQQQTQQESLSSATAALSEQGIIREIQQDLQMNPNYFHHLAAVGNYEILQFAIHNGSFTAEINRADENDWTPLHEAIRGGHKEVVTLLLDEGGLDMHAITNQGHGYSPISLSVHYHGENHPLTRMLRDREEETRVGGGGDA